MFDFDKIIERQSAVSGTMPLFARVSVTSRSPLSPYG